MHLNERDSQWRAFLLVFLPALRWVFVAFAAFGFLIGSVFAVYGFVVGRHASDSSNWPATKGRVVGSKVVQTTENRTYQEDREQGRTPFAVYRPVVQYIYSVSESTFSANRISFDLKYDSARAVCDRYPQGASVTVYYSPDDPTIAVLEPGSSTNARQCLDFGIGFMSLMVVLGGAAFWFSSRIIAASANKAPNPTGNRPKS